MLQDGEEHKVVVSAYGFGGQTAPVQVKVELPRAAPLHLNPITSVPDGKRCSYNMRSTNRPVCAFINTWKSCLRFGCR